MVEASLRKLSNFEAFPVDELWPFTVQFGIRTSIKVQFSLLAVINVPMANKDVALNQFNLSLNKTTYGTTKKKIAGEQYLSGYLRSLSHS